MSINDAGFNHPLTAQQATSHAEVRDWAEGRAPLPKRFTPDDGDREAVLAVLAKRRAVGDPWELIATPLARRIDAAQA